MEQALPIKGETQPVKKILPRLPGFIPTCWLSSGLQFFHEWLLPPLPCSLKTTLLSTATTKAEHQWEATLQNPAPLTEQCSSVKGHGFYPPNPRAPTFAALVTWRHHRVNPKSPRRCLSSRFRILRSQASASREGAAGKYLHPSISQPARNCNKTASQAKQ